MKIQHRTALGTHGKIKSRQCNEFDSWYNGRKYKLLRIQMYHSQFKSSSLSSHLRSASHLKPAYPLILGLCAFVSGIGCTGDKDTAEVQLVPSAEPTPQPSSPSLRRLTISQYQNIILDTFGEGLLVPTNLEPDVETEGFKSLGAGVSSISPVGVERYESASYSIAEQITDEPERLAFWFACDLTVSPSQACISNGIDSLGLNYGGNPLQTTSSCVE